MGKLSLEHVPLIEELTGRRILSPTRIRPRWMEGPQAEERLARVYDGMKVSDLVAEASAA